MREKMSIQTRKEILYHIQKDYKESRSKDKGKILDEFISITGYRRKYAIHLLNHSSKGIIGKKQKKIAKKRKYDEATQEALLIIWNACNQICSKRLVPFIPELLAVLERFGRISLPVEVRNNLITISAATVDRLLETKRRELSKGRSTTCAGSLLKKQIKVRTFADWDDVIPGFLEGDLVAHCGDKASGSFLYSLVLTDIASGWTECFPLLSKHAENVITALKVAQQILPFLLVGLDTDNGSEFINYELLEFCKTQEITFTRCRPYKKNDQAHVEEKNGSIVRKLIGYDRYEGVVAYNALSELYATLRLYVNFFQPSLKLISKTRDGAKVTKKYDKAKTPYQRLLCSPNFSEKNKVKLKKQYEKLDPICLLNDLEKLQNNFWEYAWKSSTTREETINSIVPIVEYNNKVTDKNQVIPFHQEATISLLKTGQKSQLNIRRYRRTKKSREKLGVRTWKTRPDRFEDVRSKICTQLELNSARTATSLLKDLIKENPEQFNINQLRTFQRRITKWRKEHVKINHENTMKNTFIANNAINQYTTFIAHSDIKE